MAEPNRYVLGELDERVRADLRDLHRIRTDVAYLRVEISGSYEFIKGQKT